MIDTDFPLLISGFRYWENYYFHELDKSIIFFSLNKTSDPFPAEVHPISSVKKYPITDIYSVFLNLALGILEYPKKYPGKEWMRSVGLLRFIQDRNISVHATVGPGGGFEEVSHLSQGLQGLRFLRDHPNVKSVFTNLSKVQEIIPKKSYRVEGIVNTDFFGYTPRAKSDKLQLLFAANPPRTRTQKGFGYLVQAFNSLDPSRYHLHIIGDWKLELGGLKHNNYTYYGTLFPQQLRQVFQKCHVFVNPAYKERIPVCSVWLSKYSYYYGKVIRTRFLPSSPVYASIDSFPTITAGEAMSTGCCLISTNHRRDHSALSPDRDYIEVRERSSEDLVKAAEYLYQNQDKMLSMAARGREKMVEFFDAKKNATFKYNIIQRGNKRWKG